GLLYQHKQTSVFSYPSIKAIFKVVGGDPDTVEEMAPAEYQGSLSPKKSASLKELPPSRTTTIKSITP
ncbi:hypothetical protein L0F63_006057, partial [Massospora cicadina]